MAGIPTGTVTFLFTDIEGSTKLARGHPETWEIARERHHAILREAIECYQGYVFQIIGDAFCAAFHTAEDALRAAVKSQINLYSENWGEVPIKVRMGIHTGKAEIHENMEYHGYLAMSRAQRLMSAGHGGQVLISAASQELLLEDLPENISLRDLGERRLKDLILPEHIYQLVIPNLPMDFPPLKTLDFYRHNLPVQLTSFVGREKEMDEIKESISTHRLVTLTGVGGTGKTRLALQVAADMLDQFPDGIWFVYLAPITDTDLISQTILSAMGIPEKPGLTQQQLLLDYLQKKKLLLLLDNCEHLIEATEKLTEILLSHAPDLKILATSREALGILGEVIWQVPSLSLPDVKQLPAIEQLAQYEAVQLFIERATLVQPHFYVTNVNAPAIAQICCRLDGIPLAIELAAARVRTLGVEQIHQRLDDRFHLLTGGNRMALERHQTLRATIDWSYNLLSEPEKTLFRRLSVFVGGWTPEAAEQICAGADSISLDNVFDLLTHLVDKSLVILDESRYRMLETTRQYAHEKLRDAGEQPPILERHLAYFLTVAEQVAHESTWTNKMKWKDRIEADDENYRAALSWSVSEKKTEPALRLLFAWKRAGGRHFSEMCDWFNKVRTLPDLVHYPIAYANLLNDMGGSHWLRRNLRQAKSLVEESREICMTLGPGGELSLAEAYAIIGEVALAENDIDAAQFPLEQSLALYKKHGVTWEIAAAIYRLGHKDLSAGHYAEAEEKYLKSQAIWKGLGDEYMVRNTLNELGITAQCRGDYERAAKFYEECIKGDREFHGPFLSISLANSAWMLLYLGDPHKAKERFKESLQLFRDDGDDNGIILCLAGLAGILEFIGSHADATRLFGAFERLLKDSETRLDPSDQDEADRYLVPVHGRLNDATFANAWAEGREMTLEKAVAFALEKTGIIRS